MRYKKTIIFSSLVTLLMFLTLSQFTLGFWGVAYADHYDFVNGTRLTGDIDSTKYNDGDVFGAQGKGLWPIYLLYFEFDEYDHVSDVGTNNYVTIEFKFLGGGTLEIQIYYYDGTIDYYYESSTSSYKTKNYDIDDYKIVRWVRFDNTEWWFPGKVYIDLCIVNYVDE